jgi:ribonuclease G
MKQIIINSEDLQTRVAVVHDGKLHDFFMERKDRDRIVGSIYKGKIKNLEPSLQAAFVDIGQGKNAFLHYWDMLPAYQDMLDGEVADDDLDNPDNPSVEVEIEEAPVEPSHFAASPNADGSENGGNKRRRYWHRRNKGNAQGQGEGGQAGKAESKLLPLNDAQTVQKPNQKRKPDLLPLNDGKPAKEKKSARQTQGGKDKPNKIQEKQEKKATEKVGLLTRILRKLLPLKKESQEKKEPVKQQAQGKGSNGRERGRQTQGQAKGKEQKGQAASGVVPLVQGGEGTPAKPKQSPRQHKQRQTQQRLEQAVEEIPNKFHIDQEILVQVTKGAIGTKGPRVTTNLSIPGRYLVLLPNSKHLGISRRVEDKEERQRLRKMLKELTLPPNMGVICRTAGAGVTQEQFQRDLDILLGYWNKGQEQAKAGTHGPVCVYQEPDLAERALRDCLTEDIDEIITDSKETFKLANDLLEQYCPQHQIKVKFHESPVPVFVRNGIASQIESIFNRKVNLPSGGYICIDETEALIAIDVNSGKNRVGKDQPETILTTNLEAVAEIARQLRLRNIGGLVVLDLIDMRSKEDQMKVYRTLKACLAEDRAKISTYPISQLGLLEMTRQREDQSLESTIYDKCPYCQGRGLVKSATTMSVEIQRRINEILGRKRNIQHLIVTVHPKTHERLSKEDHTLIQSLASDFNRRLTFRADPMLHMEEFHIIDENGNEL